MNRRHGFAAAWATFMAFQTVPVVAAQGTGLGARTCLPLGLLLALTITPIETLVDAFRSFLPTRDPD